MKTYKKQTIQSGRMIEGQRHSNTKKNRQTQPDWSCNSGAVVTDLDETSRKKLGLCNPAALGNSVSRVVRTIKASSVRKRRHGSRCESVLVVVVARLSEPWSTSATGSTAGRTHNEGFTHTPICSVAPLWPRPLSVSEKTAFIPYIFFKGWNTAVFPIVFSECSKCPIYTF